MLVDCCQHEDHFLKIDFSMPTVIGLKEVQTDFENLCLEEGFLRDQFLKAYVPVVF